MWYQFFLEQAHFAINLFAALVLFAAFWLYFDAWTGKRDTVGITRSLGFLFLSLSFLLYATHVETTIVASSFLNSGLNLVLLPIVRTAGYLLVIISLFLEPIQPKPKHTRAEALVVPPAVLALSGIGMTPFPILAAFTGWLYLRRSTVGLEYHLRPVAISFFLLSLAELLGIGVLFQKTVNIDLYNIVAPLGPLWIIEHIIILASFWVMRSWVFTYLFKRLETQLFMIFTIVIVVIYLATTVTFTALLAKNIQDEVLRELSTNVQVLQFGLASRQEETLSTAQVLAQNPQLITALEAKSRAGLGDLVQGYLLSKKQNTLVVVGDAGQVMARGEDRERVGDSLSEDPLVKRALLGESVSSVVTRQGVVAPELSVASATPVKSGAVIVGAVLAGTTIDSAFVDGLKRSTGLEGSLYADNQLSATTLTTADGSTRPVGIKEEHRDIKTKVLQKGEPFSGGVSFLGRPYFGAYLPIKDLDRNPVGMLFVGKPQFHVLQTAGKSIELTFIIASVLLVFSIVPAYLVAKYLTNQIG